MSDLTVIARLGEKLLSPTFSGATQKDGRYGFRGELGLRFPPSVAGEARPPEIKADQVILAGEGGAASFFAGHVDSLAHLELIVDAFGPALAPTGKYFVFAGNVDFAKRYKVEAGGVPFYVLPLDEATVWNELLDLFYLDRSDMKRLSSEAKVDSLVAAAEAFTGAGFPETPYATAVAEMGPVKVPDNRPV